MTEFITATLSFDIDATGLQPLLYDLEAGIPFLFVDELIVRAPQLPAKAPSWGYCWASRDNGEVRNRDAKVVVLLNV